MSLRQMVFSALSEPCRSMLAAELVQHAEELRASRPGLDTKGTKKQLRDCGLLGQSS